MSIVLEVSLRDGGGDSDKRWMRESQLVVAVKSEWWDFRHSDNISRIWTLINGEWFLVSWVEIRGRQPHATSSENTEDSEICL